VKLKEILEHLDTISPFELQEKWDNSGLVVGNLESKISKIVLSIDLDSELIESSDEGVLFIVHHPLIFGGLKSLNFAKYPANLIQKLILKNQSVIAMHTNFDKTHLNKYVFSEVLGFCIEQESDFVAKSTVNLTFEQLGKKIKEKLNLDQIKVVNKKESIKSIAITTGSGGSLIDFIDVDCFLTGDIKYHDAIKAKEQNLMLIDIGHFESERFFANAMQNLLKTLPISVIIAQSKNPFKIFPL